jgi:hypothetical protein
MKSTLADVVTAIRLGSATRANIRENLFFAFMYNILLIPLAAGVFVSLFGWSLPPMLAALAMSLSNLLHVDIQWIYLMTDLSVLALSLLYISPIRILYSLLTVIISGQIIGWIQKLPNIKIKENAKQ